MTSDLRGPVPFDIVHIAQSPFPEDPRVRREAQIAARTGARVAVIAQQGGRDRRRVSRYGPITVVRLANERRRGSAGRYILDYLDFLLRARRLIGSHPRFRSARVFHVHTLPDFLIGAVEPARRRGARVILDLHEVFPEFTRSKFPGPTGMTAGRIALGLERWSRRRADVVLTVNDVIAEHLRARPARENERLAVIHNFADPDDFGPPRAGPPEPARELRLVYHGTLTPLYGLDLAVDAVNAVRGRGTPATLDIFGDGPARASLARQIERLGLGDAVQLRGTASHQQLRELLPTYDAGFVTTKLDVMTRFSLSTKLLEYIHLGIPVVLPRIPAYLEYFSEECGWYFTPGSADGAARALEALASSGDQREARARRARAAYARRIDADREAAALTAIYGELLGGAPEAASRIRKVASATDRS